MSAISLKSITGITSITTPAGVDDQLTLHNNNTSEAVKLDGAGNLHINNQISVAGVSTFSEGVFIPDNKELKIGQLAASPDLKIYSDGTNAYIREQGPGSLYIQGVNVVLENTSGTNYFAGVSGAESIIYHNGTPKITTSNSGATVTGTLTATGADINGDLDVDGHTNLDNVSTAGVTTMSGGGVTPHNSSWGTNSRLNLYGSYGGGISFNDNGNNGFVQYVEGSGANFYLKNGAVGGTTKSSIKCVKDNTVELYYNGNKKFETTNTGAVVSGIVTATSFSGNHIGISTFNGGSVNGIAFPLNVKQNNNDADYDMGTGIKLQGGSSTEFYKWCAVVARGENNGLGGYSNSQALTFYTYNGGGASGGTEKLRITSGGYVGINTTTPSTYLMISGPGNQRQDMLRLQHEGQRNFYIQGQWGQRDVGDSNGILQYTDGGGIAFRSGATGDAGMIVSQANKVGIHTNNPSVNLHAFMANTTNASVSWGANCGQIFRNEGSELAFGLQNTNPYPFYIQARTSLSSARQLTLNPAGGAVAVGIINSFGRAFQVKGSVGVLSPSQTGVTDLITDDAGNFELGAYHSSGGSVTLKTAPAGAGNQTRLNINSTGQLTHTANKSSEFTAKFVQAHADNPAWIEIDSPTDNNLRPAYIQLKNGGNNKWGIGQIYNPTAGQSFHITEGTHNQDNSHFVIKSNNYVGINTNNPQSALHVRGAGGIRIDTLSGTPIASNSNVITDGGGNPIISGTPWYMSHTYQWQGSYGGMGYYWIKVVKSLGNSAIGYIEYMAHGDSNYPRTVRGTIAIAKYAGGSISCCHDQQTQEAGGVEVVLCGDGTVWIRLSSYDWNSDFRFRLIYGEDVTVNTVFDVTTSSDNSYGRIDPRGGASPVNSSPTILPGSNQRYSVSSNAFNPSGSNSTYSSDDHRFFRINVASQLTKGSGSFRIDHPLAGMSTSHYLQHSFVEGPQADNIYRGKTTLVAGISTVNIDTASNMTDGTFVELNTDVQCFTTNETGWTPIKGSVSGNKLTILAQDNSCTDTISWMVVGERQDDHIKNKADWTDSDGKVIVELPKSSVGFAGTESPYEEFK